MGKAHLNLRVASLLMMLILLYTVPILKVVLVDHFRFRGTYATALSVSEILSILYLLLSIAYRGHVEYNMEAVGLTSHYHTKKFCRRCNNFKPERAHHCSMCGHCIRKMDHHCFWINNCVNYDNQGHFIRFLFFSALANLLILLYTVVKSIGIFFYGHSLKNRGTYVIFVVSGMLSLAVFIMTIWFFYLQLKLAFVNMTFIEQLKQEDLRKVRGLDSFVSPYDRGVMNNLKDTLGSPYALFLIGPFGDGLRFVKTCSGNYWSNPHEYYSIEDAMIV